MEFAQIRDNEKTVDHASCPGYGMFKDQIRLVEGILTDGSTVYSLLIGNVRIECVRYEVATQLLSDLTEKGEFIVYVDA